MESSLALSTVRRQVRTFLTEVLTNNASEAGEDAVERAILVIDELTSCDADPTRFCDETWPA